MEKRVFVCDKCGREELQNCDWVNIHISYDDPVQERDIPNERDKNNREFIICRKCAKELRNWFSAYQKYKDKYTE